jgi:hypothetical protein
MRRVTVCKANRKTTEGDSHPDRDAQFGYINTQVTTALAENQPATTGANIAPKATRKKSGSMTS